MCLRYNSASKKGRTPIIGRTQLKDRLI